MKFPPTINQRIIDEIVGRMILKVMFLTHYLMNMSLEWQDVARWNQMIASYVIPQTTVPEIVSIHRRNVTLSWEAVYYPSGQDQTKYGVNITICLADTVLQSQYQGLLSLTSAVDDNKVPGCRVVTKEKKDLITTNFNEDTDTRVLLTHIRDLQPSMNYKFR